MHLQDGSEAGDAASADKVNPGNELMLGPGRFVRLLEVVPVEGGARPLRGVAQDRAALVVRQLRTVRPG